ncbi:MAG: hypothetical protein IJU12_04705 [Clostridia bacterium]|nr:hypothetical protein [Clostridia bacterium]
MDFAVIKGSLLIAFEKWKKGQGRPQPALPGIAFYLWRYGGIAIPPSTIRRRARSARKIIQWIIFSEGGLKAQGKQLKAASYVNFWP